MGGVLRRVGLALPFAALPLLAACNESAEGDRATVGWPPGSAGVACNYLDYDRVADQLGTRFDAAGGARKDDTYTCALTTSGQDFPDLTLSITKTAATDVIFQATVAPSGSTLVNGLGKIAYQRGVVASSGSGPGVELGWLSATGRLMIVRYTFAADASTAEVTEFSPRLLALAKAIDVLVAPA